MDSSSYRGWPLGLLSVLMLIGCGEAGPEIVRVTGTITYGGGPWPADGGVLLAPVEAASGQPVIPTLVTMARDGSFVAESSVGNGLVPGKYRVGVECWELPPDESRAEHPFGKSYVPKKYQNSATSGLEFEVPSGSGEINVKLDVPKH
jgi:hypothetical protein